MLKKVLVSIMMLGVLAVGGLVAAPVYADNDVCSDPNISEDIKAAAGCKTTTSADTVINNVIQVVLSLVGLLAVGVIIYGGITYTISAGDAAKVQRGKNIILYGIVGLVVALLAYAIMFFVSGALNG